MLSPERQSARMSKIKNGGLDQYGKVWSLNGVGGERVNVLWQQVKDQEATTSEAVQSIQQTVNALQKVRTSHCVWLMLNCAWCIVIFGSAGWVYQTAGQMLSLCLDVYHGGTNRNRCTQRLVILHCIDLLMNRTQNKSQVYLTYFTVFLGHHRKYLQVTLCE